MHTEAERDKALNRTKIALMTKPDSVFFSDLAFSLKYEWTHDLPTAGVNGVSMKINPDFFMGLTPNQRLGLIVHETLHVAYMHIFRRGSRDPKRYNIACDHVINLVLLERGFELPPNGYHDPRFAGMTSEEVYPHIPDDPSSDCMEDLLEPGADPAALEETIKENLIRAAMRSEQENDAPGTIPGDIKLFLDSLLNPKLPWNRILQKYLHAYTKCDFSLKKPNRRFLPDFYLPSLYSESLMDIAIAVDISGSVTDHEFKTFVSEIASIFRMMKPKEIKLLQFDTTIKSVDSLKGFHDLMQVNFHGRGGTNITPIIEWAMKTKPKLLLVFTDGEFKKPRITPKQDIIWLIHDNPLFTAQFGKVIHYSVKPSI